MTDVLPDATTSQVFVMDYQTQQTSVQSVAYCSPRSFMGESPQQQNHGAVISRRIIGQSASV